jgi:hypothetical protein
VSLYRAGPDWGGDFLRIAVNWLIG